MTPSTFSANCCAKFPHGGEQIADDYLGDWSINTQIKIVQIETKLASKIDLCKFSKFRNLQPANK
jgi:hypothetical protein